MRIADTARALGYDGVPRDEAGMHELIGKLETYAAELDGARAGNGE